MKSIDFSLPFLCVMTSWGENSVRAVSVFSRLSLIKAVFSSPFSSK